MNWLPLSQVSIQEPINYSQEGHPRTVGSIDKLPDMYIISGHHLLSLETETWSRHCKFAACLLCRIRLIMTHPHRAMMRFKGVNPWEVYSALLCAWYRVIAMNGIIIQAVLQPCLLWYSSMLCP